MNRLVRTLENHGVAWRLGASGGVEALDVWMRLPMPSGAEGPAQAGADWVPVTSATIAGFLGY